MAADGERDGMGWGSREWWGGVGRGRKAEFSLMIKCEIGQNIPDDVGKSMGGRGRQQQQQRRRREAGPRSGLRFFLLSGGRGVTTMEVPNYEKSDLH